MSKEIQNNTKRRWWYDKEMVKELTRLFRDEELTIEEATKRIGITVDQLQYYRDVINKDFCIAVDWRWWENKEGGESEKLGKLENAYSQGCTDLEACGYANISMAQLEYYQKLFPDFMEKKALFRSRPNMIARTVLINAMKSLTDDDKKNMDSKTISLHNRIRFLSAKHYADRKLPDYKPKLDLSSMGDKLPNSLTVEIVHVNKNESDNSISEEHGEQNEDNS